MADMYDQGVEARPFLHLKNFCNADAIERVSSEPVNSLRGKRDYISRPECRDCAFHRSGFKTIEDLRVLAHV